MDRDRLRKVGALVLAGAFLLSATLAVTAAPERMAEETPVAPSFFDGLTAWVSLWLDAGPMAAVGFWQDTGFEDGSDQVARAGSRTADNEDEPTATPQLGGEADPDG